jgi:spermidine synthase
MPFNQTICHEAATSGKSLWWLMAIIYTLSGLTSLAYEVLWARMLSLQFGVSIFGVVLAVAAFMIGLGLGSLGGIRWARRCKRPLTLFAMLEASIALYALVLPAMSHAFGAWMEGVSIEWTLLQWYLLQGAAALLLLVIPACAMGVGFAVMLKAASGTPLSLGKLYGLNTMGGALGALFPLWALPSLGWMTSVRVIALLGLVVGATAFALSRLAEFGNASQPALKADQSHPRLMSLLIYAGIGAGSIMLEIGWIRLYGMIMLRTEYVLGVILAVFLLGVALGSMLLPRVHANLLNVLMPVVTGLGVLAGLYLLPATSAWVEHSDFTSFLGTLWSQSAMLGIFTLPVTLALGAWLPLLANRLGDAETSGVWLYGANSLGGGLGAIVACVVLIPLVGSAAMVAIAGLVITMFGLLWVNSRWVWIAFLAMLLLAWPVRNMPPVNSLLPRVEANTRDLYLYEDAISLSHVVQQPDGQRVLLSDLQRMDASSEPEAVKIQEDQARLALLLHHSPQSVLFLGLGTGISMAGSLGFPDLQRSAVELSQGSIYAAKNWFAPINANIAEHGSIKRDDARHFLSSTPQHFDVIIGDLFHPDLAGMGSLLSVQQFQRARDHLTSDGIFVQWLALNQFDVQSLGAVLRGFKRVFPGASLFMDGMHLALVGPRQPLSARSMLDNLKRLSAQQQSEVTGGEGAWTWLGRYWGPIAEAEGPIQDEWTPFIEFRLPRARYDGNINVSSLIMWLLERHPDADAAMKQLGIAVDDRGTFGRAYVATELDVRAWAASLQGDSEKAGQLVWLANRANPLDYWIANALADDMMESISQASRHGLSKREALERILVVDPNFVGALRALWRLERSEGNVQEAERYRQRLLAVSPLDLEAASAR